MSACVCQWDAHEGVHKDCFCFHVTYMQQCIWLRNLTMLSDGQLPQPERCLVVGHLFTCKICRPTIYISSQNYSSCHIHGSACLSATYTYQSNQAALAQDPSGTCRQMLPLRRPGSAALLTHLQDLPPHPPPFPGARLACQRATCQL